MRSRFDEQLTRLNAEIIDMGTLIEHAIEESVQALSSRDVVRARKIIALDREVDQKEREVENQCLKLLLQQQPVARDLRFISAALKMITDMERIGDQAADVAEIVTMLDGGHEGEFPQIQEMGGETIKMVRGAIDAFVRRDLSLAEWVVAMDDKVDGLFVAAKDALIELLRRDAGAGVLALDLLMIAKYLERIGDHAVNIAEWVVFAITGVHKEN
ncbi:MAG TPA: phosphate signaling complex protein PhoU [Candidatus Pullichristensenella avicola]|nr:phosphate signaling complex protein PhoU [Candidatus Pullichristensenella avicola]